MDNKLDSKEAISVVRNGGQQNGHESNPKTKAAKAPAAVKPAKTQPASRDRTPSKPEVKKAAMTSQKTIEKKPGKEKVGVEKDRSTSKSRTVADQKKLKKTSSKEAAAKVNGEVLTNGSIDSQNSLQSLQQQHSLDKKPEVPEQPRDEKPRTPVEVKKETKNAEIKVNGESHHEPEKEVHSKPSSPKPQDELAAIIDEEAEFRRKEKTNKKLSARHRQKSVEDAQPAAESSEPKSNQMDKIERFQSSYKRESFDRPRTSLRPPSARPASSRPAAPRRKDKNIEIVLQPDEAMKLGDINVKMENFTKELEDDGENLVIIEDSSVVSDTFMSDRLAQSNSEETNEDEQGKLVQQILETEKNFEGALGMEVKKTEIVR